MALIGSCVIGTQSDEIMVFKAPQLEVFDEIFSDSGESTDVEIIWRTVSFSGVMHFAFITTDVEYVRRIVAKVEAVLDEMEHVTGKSSYIAYTTAEILNEKIADFTAKAEM